MKSSEPEDKAQRKVKNENPREWVRIIFWELLQGIYFWELWPSITLHGKVEIYRDTGVSKNVVASPFGIIDT